MRSLLTILIGCAMVLPTLGQDTLVIFIDDDGRKMAMEKAKRFRKVYPIGDAWMAEEYRLDSTLVSTCTYDSRKLKRRQGAFSVYHKNGRKIIFGHYKDDFRCNTWFWWHETGAPMKKGSFDNDDRKTGEWQRWFANGQTDYKGSYLRNKKHGHWYYYLPDGRLSAHEKYENGFRKLVQYYSPTGTKLVPNFREQILPKFKGGKKALDLYLEDAIHYPQEAQRQKISGTVVVSFWVTMHGIVKSPEVVSSDNALLNEEAIRVVNGMPAWEPGREHNRPAKAKMEVAVKFKL